MSLLRKRVKAILDIGKEIAMTKELVYLTDLNSAATYTTKYIFTRGIFKDIFTGNQLINQEFCGRLVFEEGGFGIDNISPNDTFVRAGQFSAYVKSFLFDQEKLIHKKYTDANTFTKTLGLGFRLEPDLSGSKEKRPIYYINLTESLLFLRKALLDEAQSQRIPFNLNDSNNCAYEHFQKHAKLQNRFQRMINLLQKSINMETVLQHALKEIKYYKNILGAVDIYNVESKARETELKLDNLLNDLSKIDF